MMDRELHDLVVIGAGSVGLTMAAAWARLGRECVLVERHEQQYGLPRAGHIDHEVMRMLQVLGANSPVIADAYEPSYYRWVNAHGETLLEFPWGEHGVSGWHSDYMQNSAILEASLLEVVRRSGRCEVATGWELREIAQSEEYAEVRIERVEKVAGEPMPRPTGEERVIRARYVVASDGANSHARRLLGIEREDLGFNERWLVVDARKKREVVFDFDSGQVCDPARAVTVLPLGKHHRRFEWHVKPGEDPREFEQPARAWELLAEFGLGPDDVEPIRQLVYTFEARAAHQWRAGRVFLAGDAAHTMPPFMGQGMCSGMRDAFNLAWKLDLVTRGRAPERLLDTYQTERAPHVHDWTVISLESGRITCVADPVLAQQRDDSFRAGYRPPIPEFPQLAGGVVDLDEAGTPIAPAGELGVQGRITLNGITGLFDDVLPSNGFVLLSIEPAGDLAELSHDPAARAIDAFVVHVGPEIDIDGTYAAWFAERGVTSVLVRPDFYVYGGASDIEGARRLLAGAADTIGLAQMGVGHA
jgi:2-polyprenyl-6-methoxyphenol hydroxylase-like FAD-dependent oxidoreductase